MLLHGYLNGAMVACWRGSRNEIDSEACSRKINIHGIFGFSKGFLLDLTMQGRTVHPILFEKLWIWLNRRGQHRARINRLCATIVAPMVAK